MGGQTRRTDDAARRCSADCSIENTCAPLESRRWQNAMAVRKDLKLHVLVDLETSSGRNLLQKKQQFDSLRDYVFIIHLEIQVEDFYKTQ